MSDETPQWPQQPPTQQYVQPAPPTATQQYPTQVQYAPPPPGVPPTAAPAQQYPPPPAKPRKGHKRWIIPTCTAIAGLIVGSASAGGDAATPAAAPTPVTVTQTVQPGADLSAREAQLRQRETAVAQREAKVKAAEGAAVAAVKANQFGDGTYIVGTDIQPGQYRSKTADDCYWARLKSTDGSLDSIIANGNGTGGQELVTIKSSDKAFESRSCGTWQRLK